MYIFNSKTAEDEKKSESGIDSKFIKTRQILLSGEINNELAEKVIRQLLILEAESDEPIKIYIDSPGGAVYSGFAIFDMIRFIKAPVYCIGMGLVASAAALILLAADKSRRFGLPNSRYLIHQPLGGLQGTATEMEIYADHIERTKAALNEIITKETGKSLEQVQKDTDRDFWLHADEAVEYGLISKIVSNREQL